MGSLAHALPSFLGSGPRDHVFVYFTDHGATGILVFPSDDVSSAYHFDRGFCRCHCYWVLGIVRRALCVLSKCCSAELCPSQFLLTLNIDFYIYLFYVPRHTCGDLRTVFGGQFFQPAHPGDQTQLIIRRGSLLLPWLSRLTSPFLSL